MKGILIVIMAFALNGCASMMGYNFEPKSLEDAIKLITYTTDEFEGDSWLETKSVANLSYPNAIYKYRASFNDQGKFQFIQVYVNLRLSEWAFIYDAIIKSEDTDFKEIDRKVMAADAVHEDIAIKISKETLGRMANKDTLVKLKGKRGEYVFSISKNMSKAFYSKLIEKIQI